MSLVSTTGAIPFPRGKNTMNQTFASAFAIATTVLFGACGSLPRWEDTIKAPAFQAVREIVVANVQLDSAITGTANGRVVVAKEKLFDKTVLLGALESYDVVSGSKIAERIPTGDWRETWHSGALVAGAKGEALIGLGGEFRQINSDLADTQRFDQAYTYVNPVWTPSGWLIGGADKFDGGDSVKYYFNDPTGDSPPSFAFDGCGWVRGIAKLGHTTFAVVSRRDGNAKNWFELLTFTKGAQHVYRALKTDTGRVGGYCGGLQGLELLAIEADRAREEVIVVWSFDKDENYELHVTAFSEDGRLLRDQKLLSRYERVYAAKIFRGGVAVVGLSKLGAGGFTLKLISTDSTIKEGEAIPNKDVDSVSSFRIAQADPSHLVVAYTSPSRTAAQVRSTVLKVYDLGPGPGDEPLHLE